MSDQEQKPLDSEDAGLAFGYSGEQPEATQQPGPAAKEEPAPDASTAQAPESTTEESTQQEPAPAPAPAAERDPLAELSKLDGRLRNLSGEINALKGLSSDIAALKGSVEQITGKLTQAASAAATEQGAEAPTKQQISVALKDGEKFKQLQEDFPEWADALQEAIGSQSEAIKQAVLKELPSPKEVDTTQFLTAEQFEQQLGASIEQQIPIYLKHPTWKKDINSQEFMSWLPTQPDDVKALAESEDPEDAITLLDKFHGRAAPPPKTNSQKSRLEASVAPDTGANRAVPKAISEDEAMKIGYSRA